MNQHIVAGLDPGAALDQEFGGAAFKHDRGGGVVVDVVGELDQRRRRDQSRGRIGPALGTEGGDAVAWRNFAHPFADRNHLARGFEPEPGGERRWIGAGAVIDIDEIDPDRALLDQRLPRPGRAEFDLVPLDHLGSAGGTQYRLGRFHRVGPLHCGRARMGREPSGFKTGRRRVVRAGGSPMTKPINDDPIILYGIANCDTVQKARTWLDGRGIAFRFHDYKKAGADPDLLASWAANVGWEALLNRGGTTFRKLADVEKSDIDEGKAIALMTAQPSLIRRPVLEQGPKLLVGFKPSAYEDALAG